MAAAREPQQQPDQHETDRQAADVAEEKLRHRPVERAQSRAWRRAAPARSRLRSCGSAPKSARSNRPAVIGTISATVIQSMPSMKLTRLTNHSTAMISQRRARATSGSMRHDAQLGRQRRDHGDDRDGLQQQARQRPGARRCRRRADGASAASPPRRAARAGERRSRVAGSNSAMAGERSGSAEHDRDTAALRGRHCVRRAGIGPRQRIARKQRPQQDDQRRAAETGERGLPRRRRSPIAHHRS